MDGRPRGTVRLRLVAAAALGLALACAGTGGARRPQLEPAAPAASPLEVTRAFYVALHGGDAEAAAKLVGSPNARSATQSFVSLANAYHELELAVVERFGPEAARAVGYRERIAAEDEALRAATVRESGEDAVVTSVGGQTLATLRKVDGSWRVLLDDALSTEGGTAALALEAAASSEAASRVAPAIRHGLFDAPEDALEAFRNEVSVGLQGGRPDLTEPPEKPAPDDVKL